MAASGFRPAPAEQFLYFVVLALLIGFVEEVIFRGVILQLFLPHGNTAAILWSSVLFALAHAINLLGGQAWGQTAIQVGYSLAVGVMLAVLVLVTKSIWPGMAFHVINDLIQFLGKEAAGPWWADVLILTLVAGTAAFLLTTFRARQRLSPVR